uniref:Uncharacterized protein n=1 Tax=Rhizophagus irregularis (strain DAOM 181602 / DAOM 197198 / MUCL 43194) TaxID=747089 RepID=U9SZV8_RHIID
MPILYYLDESGPQRPFIREQLMHIKETFMLPPRWVLEDNQMRTSITLSFSNHARFVHLDPSALVGEKKGRFGNVDCHYIQRPSLTLHCIHLDVIPPRI